jgi:hypothetical protein
MASNNSFSSSGFERQATEQAAKDRLRASAESWPVMDDWYADSSPLERA